MTCRRPGPMAPATVAKTPRISDDDRLVNMWLHNRSVNTARAYRADVDAFRQWADMPLADVVLDDLQGWFDSLTGSDATRRRKLASVKSALAFGVRVVFWMWTLAQRFALSAGEIVSVSASSRKRMCGALSTRSRAHESGSRSGFCTSWVCAFLKCAPSPGEI